MLPSPFRSILPNTQSAFCKLVPPAPSAFSNSDLVILPSPSPSICENRSFSAALRLVAPGWVWPCDCAANSLFQVAGDSWPLLDPLVDAGVDVCVESVSENELAG